MTLPEPQGVEVRCEAETGRFAESIEGEVTAGQVFEQETPSGWVVLLSPTGTGWFLSVTTPDRPGEDMARLTPPWHSVPNPRQIEGWHFRNAGNTGPNDGSVNAPQQRRDFVFSPEVGRGIEYLGSDTSRADVERVAAFGRGWLEVGDYRLTAPAAGERAAFERMSFSVCLDWAQVP